MEVIDNKTFYSLHETLLKLQVNLLKQNYGDFESLQWESVFFRSEKLSPKPNRFEIEIFKTYKDHTFEPLSEPEEKLVESICYVFANADEESYLGISEWRKNGVFPRTIDIFFGLKPDKRLSHEQQEIFNSSLSQILSAFTGENDEEELERPFDVDATSKFLAADYNLGRLELKKHLTNPDAGDSLYLTPTQFEKI